MFNAAQEQFGGNPFTALVNNANRANAGSANPQAGQENRAPLPNPWGGAPGTTAGSSGTPTGTASTTETNAGPPGGIGGTSAMAGMFNSPGMQSLMQQMVENPQMMQSMMNAPYVQNMLQQLGSNPNLAEQMILNNPLFSGKLFFFFKACFFLNILIVNCLFRKCCIEGSNENYDAQLCGSAK